MINDTVTDNAAVSSLVDFLGNNSHRTWNKLFSILDEAVKMVTSKITVGIL